MHEHMSHTDWEQQRKKEKVVQEWKKKQRERESWEGVRGEIQEGLRGANPALRQEPLTQVVK